MKNLLLVFTLALSVFSASSVYATLLLSNLGSTIDGDYLGAPDFADDFMTGNVALQLTSIDLFWVIGLGGTSNRVGIFTDGGGEEDGPTFSQVGDWFTNPTAITDNTLISYAGNVDLAANTTYWITVDVLDSSEIGYTFGQVVFSDPDTQGANIIGPNPGSAYGNIQTGYWAADSSNLLYALNGNAAPTPATLALFGLGLAGLGWTRRRKA